MGICTELNQEYKDEPRQKAAFAMQDTLRKHVRPDEKPDWKASHYTWLLSCYVKMDLERGATKPVYGKKLGDYLFENDQYKPATLEKRHGRLLVAAKWTEPVMDFDPKSIDMTAFGAATNP